MPSQSSRIVAAFGAALVIATSACAGADPAIVDAAPFASLAGPGTSSTTSSTAAPDGAASPTTTQPPTPAVVTRGVAVAPAGGVMSSDTPGGSPAGMIHEGVLLPFLRREAGWLEVVTTCNPTTWVPADEVEVHPPAAPVEVGPGLDLGDVVVVLDPGHGDRDWGGVGPEGTAEKHVNLDIAERTRDLMENARDIDWSTGEITLGTDVPAFGRVWLTRERSGPSDGDYELGLAYRSELANAAGAHALVSIHNNTVPKVDTEIPGTEVFYAVSVPGSDRLAGLLYEEVVRSLSAFDAPWRGGGQLGARARVDPGTDTDYYGLLRRAEMPSAIVEGVYISEPDEEALLATEAFRQAYAEGVYRGLVRFFTTADEGGPVFTPEPFPDDAGTVDTSKCVVPEQPGS